MVKISFTNGSKWHHQEKRENNKQKRNSQKERKKKRERRKHKIQRGDRRNILIQTTNMFFNTGKRRELKK